MTVFLTPVLAQTAFDWFDNLFRSDTPVSVLALVALIIFGAGIWKFGGSLFSTVDTLAKSAKAAQASAQDAQDKAEATIAALAAIGARMAEGQQATVKELQKQTGIATEQITLLGSLKSDFAAQLSTVSAAATTEVKAALSDHDAVAKDGIKALKDAIAELRTEVRDGHRLQRAEFEAKLKGLEGKADDILAVLKPPAPAAPVIAVAAVVEQQPAPVAEKAIEP